MKKFVAGIIIGAGLMIGMSASAGVANYVGSVIQGQFNVKLNGQELEQPGLIIDGVSYLPTRTVAEMFGAEVKFDADMGIELTKKMELIPTSPSSPIIPHDPVSPKPFKPEFDASSRIDDINDLIRILNIQLMMERENANSPIDDARRVALEQIQVLENKIAELEAEKAQLLGTSE